MDIVVGSDNPIKLTCTKEAFLEVFPDTNFSFKAVKVNSGVSDQPVGDNETYLGAKNRAVNVKSIIPQADFWIGIEGGIKKFNDQLYAFAWIYILNDQLNGKSQTATFELPHEVQQVVNQGMELGHADDLLYNRKNSKHQNGIVGLLTNNIIDRRLYYKHAIILALIPFMHSDLFVNG